MANQRVVGKSKKHVYIKSQHEGAHMHCVNRIVEYRYPEDAKRAIQMLNEVRFMGRYVYVRYLRGPKGVLCLHMQCFFFFITL